MILPVGFHVGEGHRVRRLVGGSRRCRIYLLDSEEHGPGRVALKVARHDGARRIEDVLAGREGIEREFRTMGWLHRRASSAVPQPIALVRSYTVGEAARRLVLPHVEHRLGEPYQVREFVNGRSLLHHVADGALDDERALQIALRLVLLARNAAVLGMRVQVWRPEAFVLDAVGENLSIVDLSAVRPMEGGEIALGEAVVRPDSEVDGLRMEAGLLRLLVMVFGGAAAPPWPIGPAHADRWRKLLVERRVEAGLVRWLTDGLAGGDGGALAEAERTLRAQLGASPVPARSGERELVSGGRLASGSLVGGRFRVERLLARGGRGEIHLATDLSSGAEVAVKTSSYNYDSGREFQQELPARRRELAHEYAMLRRFASRTNMLPQPIALVEEQAEGGWFDLDAALGRSEPHLVMKRISGVQLLDLLPAPREGLEGQADRFNRLPVRFVLRLVAQLADLLETIHSAGFVFQDLKPENVLHDPAAENLFLVDLASVCPWSPEEGMDRTSIAFGSQTHGFAAPEFEERWHLSDPRFDLYSLGATAFHLLTGINPERLAVVQGEEYPVLPLSALSDQPRLVQDLIARCLAPVDERFAGAAELRDAAVRVRLALSSGRPMDVRTPRVRYGEAGVRVEWRLPPDPRVQGIRVSRSWGVPGAEGEGARDEAKALRVSADATELVDAAAMGRDVTWTITTVSDRGEASRGVTVRAVACPPPECFTVSRDFSAHRILVEGIPPCDGLLLRVREDSPPLGPEDGEEVLLPSPKGGRVEVVRPARPGVREVYALVAVHAGRTSVPLFAEAVALPSVPVPGPLRALQCPDGVHLRWPLPVQGVVVERHGPEGVVVLSPAPGACSVHDALVSSGERVRYVLRVQHEEVISGPLDQVEIHRWPASPAFRVDAGVERLRVTLLDEPDPRVRAVVLSVDGVEHRFELSRSVGEHLTVGAAAAREVELGLRWLVDGGECGPVDHRKVRVASASERPSLRLLSDVLPLRFEVGMLVSGEWCSLASWLSSWADAPSLVVHCSDGRLLEPDASAEVVLDEAASPAATETWMALLVFEGGSVLASEPLTCRVRERLPPPGVEVGLGSIRLVHTGLQGVPVDIRVEDGSRVEYHLGVQAGTRLLQQEDHEVRVCWRRHVDGPEMPWSEPVSVRVLERPPAVAMPRAFLQDSEVHLRWSHPARPGTTFEVERLEAGQVVPVYSGGGQEAVDPAGTPGMHWRIRACRDGFRGPFVEVACDEVTETGPVVACVPAGAAERFVGPSFSGVRSLRFLGLPSVGDVIEVTGLRRGEMVEVRDHEMSVPLACTLATGPRVLLPVLGAGPRVCVLSGRPGFRLRSRGWVEREAGRVVRIVCGGDRALHLCAGEGSLDWSGVRVFLHHEGGASTPLALARGVADSVTVMVPESCVPWVSVSLTGGSVPLLALVVVRGADSVVAEQVWMDGGIGWCWRALGEVSRRLGAPMLTGSPGVESSVEFVVRGRPVLVVLRILSLTGRGGMRVEAEVSSPESVEVRRWWVEAVSRVGGCGGPNRELTDWLAGVIVAGLRGASQAGAGLLTAR